MIDRDAMLELTRRMTPERTCLRRMAGAYFDENGELDNTFNIFVRGLKPAELAKNLAIAKAIPFGRTNDQLKEYRFREGAKAGDSFARLLMGIRSCALENDLLLEVLYEQIGLHYVAFGPFAFSLFHGVFDIPGKAKDKSYLYDGDRVYEFLIGSICPLTDRYEMGEPDYGFLYPAYAERSAILNAIDIFEKDPKNPQQDMTQTLLG